MRTLLGLALLGTVSLWAATAGAFGPGLRVAREPLHSYGITEVRRLDSTLPTGMALWGNLLIYALKGGLYGPPGQDTLAHLYVLNLDAGVAAEPFGPWPPDSWPSNLQVAWPWVLWADSRNRDPTRDRTRNYPIPGDCGGIGTDIYAGNLETGEVKRVTPACTVYERTFSASGDVVVWEDSRSIKPGDAAPRREIWGRRLGGGDEFPIASDLPMGPGGFPVVYRDVVYWTEPDPTNPQGARVYSLDLQTGTKSEIAAGPGWVVGAGDRALYLAEVGRQSADRWLRRLDLATMNSVTIASGQLGMYVAINEPYVLFTRGSTDQQYGPGTADIYGFDLETGTEFPVATGPGVQTGQVINGETVARVDWSNSRRRDTSTLPCSPRFYCPTDPDIVVARLSRVER